MPFKPTSGTARKHLVKGKAQLCFVIFRFFGSTESDPLYKLWLYQPIRWGCQIWWETEEIQVEN